MSSARTVGCLIVLAGIVAVHTGHQSRLGAVSLDSSKSQVVSHQEPW